MGTQECTKRVNNHTANVYLGFNTRCISGNRLSSGSKGKGRTPNKNALAQFIAPLEIMPYNDQAAQCYGDLRAYFKRQGNPIDSLDTLIAAHALSINSTLVTNNEKEFIRIPDLKIENWVK